MDVLDKSGINSLSGFAYQIRVFVLYMLKMNEGMQAEFETIDDVAIKKLTPETIDDNEERFKSRIVSSKEIRAIQVKRTNITKKIAKKLLFNWILLEKSDNTVTEYILVTDGIYQNKDIIFDITAKDLYSEILNSVKSPKSAITKVKIKFEKDEQGFFDAYEAVKSKYKFISIESINQKIDDECKILFKKSGVQTDTYYNRIMELLKYITYEIMKSVNQKKPFIISYDAMMYYLEDICSRLTDKIRLPGYSEFEKLNKIDFEDSKISQSREYKQLMACKMSSSMIKNHLQYECYYQSIRYQYLELNQINKINNIEVTTYHNYQDVKFELQVEGNDIPAKRLCATKEKSNSYADVEQIKYGSIIYLTREDEVEHQISWEDDENEKS